MFHAVSTPRFLSPEASMSAPALVSIKSPNGLAVGQALKVDDHFLDLDIVAVLPREVPMEFRLELPRADETVRGTLSIVSTSGERHRARVLDIAPEDREVFGAWWDAHRAGRASFRPRLTVHGEPERGMHGASDEETGVALSRMDERRARMTARFSESSWIEESTGEIFVRDLLPNLPPPTEPRLASTQPRPRPAPVRQVPLPTAASLGIQGAPFPGASRVPPPVHASQTRRPVPAPPVQATPPTAQVPPAGSPARVAPPPAAAPQPAAPARPAPGPAQVFIDVRGQGSSATLEVGWTDPQLLVQALIDGLATGMLRLPASAVAAWPKSPTVRLHTPRGLDLQARAHHITDSRGSVLYQLELPPDALGRLQREAMGG